jgi:hypothetical protein
MCEPGDGSIAAKALKRLLGWPAIYFVGTPRVATWELWIYCTSPPHGSLVAGGFSASTVRAAAAQRPTTLA